MRTSPGELYKFERFMFEVIPCSDEGRSGKMPTRLGYFVAFDLVTSRLPFFDRKTTLPR